MGRSRYKIYEPTHPHFLTCTVSHWLPIFTNTNSVEILIDSLTHLQKSDNLTIFAYVILENHLHLVASSDDINKTMQKFKSYSAYELLQLLQKTTQPHSYDSLPSIKKHTKKNQPIKYGKRDFIQN